MLYPQTSTSYSGGPSWVLLPLIFETSGTLPWEFRFVALSAQQSRVFFSSHFPTLQLCRIASFQLLAPRSGTGYLWGSDCSLGLSLTPRTRIYHRTEYNQLKCYFQ